MRLPSYMFAHSKLKGIPSGNALAKVTESVRKIPNALARKTRLPAGSDVPTLRLPSLRRKP